MIYTSKIQKAIDFATEVHKEQKRKGKDIPYIVHPLGVGLILAKAGSGEDVVVAGILHDTIEDSVEEHRVTKEMLTEQFGEHIAELVNSVSEKDKKLSWTERKKAALEEMQQFSNDSFFLKSADIINNNTDLVRDYERDGDSIFERFNAPKPKKEEVLKHALEVIDVILAAWEENPLRVDLEQLSKKLTEISNG